MWWCCWTTEGSGEAVNFSDIPPSKVADPSLLTQLTAQAAHVRKGDGIPLSVCQY